VEWDIYKCENNHYIIVQRKKDWPDRVQSYFFCDICGLIADYIGSAKSLTEIEKEIKKKQKGVKL